MEVRSRGVSPTGAIAEGWNIIKDEYWTFFLISLFWLVIVIVVSLIIGLLNDGLTLAINASFGNPDLNKTDGLSVEKLIPGIASSIVTSITSFGVTTISSVLMIGVYKSLETKVTTGRFEFGDIFSGYSKLVPCLIVSLLLSVVHLVVGIVGLLITMSFGINLDPDSFFKNGNPDFSLINNSLGVFATLAILTIFVELVIAIATMFVYPLIASRDVSGFQAISISVSKGFGNIFGILGLCILQFLLIIAGLLACGVGILFVFPILFASTFAAYKSVFGESDALGRFNQPPPPPIFNVSQNH